MKAAGATPGAGLRVLLAEDNRVNQRVAEALLLRAGHTVDTVENGAEALAATRSTGYDVVLMDIHMPEMDGLTATRKIRGLGGPAGSIPIIAVTANALRGDRGNTSNLEWIIMSQNPFARNRRMRPSYDIVSRRR
jgi:CheY-like chemotaxis protein